MTSLSTVGVVLAAMAVVALVEAVVPLRPRGAWNRAHLGPNLALTFITFGTNVAFNAALVAALVWLEAHRIGLLNLRPLGWAPALAVVVVVLDGSFYVAHVAMHRIPLLWRYHRVHHSDPAVDVTTTIRQHPGEGVIRYAFMAAFALPLGASPAAFAVYRTWSALSGLLEHANVRVPPCLDAWLSLVTTWPGVHKVHHSRAPHETNTNYGNILSVFDRLCATFTPPKDVRTIDYGLDGLDAAASQTTARLLALPFRQVTSPSSTADALRPHPTA